jgi:hypothetical protein
MPQPRMDERACVPGGSQGGLVVPLIIVVMSGVPGPALRQGVANYGEGADYADSVINAATAIAGIAGGGSYTDLANAAANPDTASQIMQALATVTHGK